LNTDLIWKYKSVDEISTLIKDGTHNPPVRVNSGIPLLSAQNISNGEIDFSNITYISEENFCKIHKYFDIKNGDVLLTIVGTLGETAIVNTDNKFSLQRSVAIIRLKNEVYNHFFKYYIQSFRFQKELKLRSKKAVQTGIYLGDLKKFMVPVPPFVEQRGIAEVLGTVDEVIRWTDAVIAKAEELKRGLMQKLLTRGIGHTEFKDTELGKIPKTWEIKHIEDVCEKPQYGYTASAKEKPVGPKFLRITDIQDGKVDWNKVPFCECAGDVTQYRLNKGDIVFARTGATTGKSYLITDEPNAIFASYLIRLRTKPGTDYSYLSVFFDSEIYWKQINQQRVGSAQGGVNASTLSSIKLPLPSLVEQQKISQLSQGIKNNIEVKQKEKIKLGHLKNGLMWVLLSGQVRVGLDEGGLQRIDKRRRTSI
jgi:type I restriction enzyme S subunit